MSRFSKFTDDVEEPVNVAGSFECQRCDLHVKGAYLDDEGVLWWKCPDGHVSKIKDFM